MSAELQRKSWREIHRYGIVVPIGMRGWAGTISSNHDGFAQRVLTSPGWSAISTVPRAKRPDLALQQLLEASDVGFVADPSPTPSTRYQGLRSQAGLLAHETYYYIGYLLRRPFLKVAHA